MSQRPLNPLYPRSGRTTYHGIPAYLSLPLRHPQSQAVMPTLPTCSYAPAVLRFLSSKRGLTLSGLREDRTF